MLVRVAKLDARGSRRSAKRCLEVEGRRDDRLGAPMWKTALCVGNASRLSPTLIACLRFVVEHQQLIAVADRARVVDDFVGDELARAFPVEIGNELQRRVAAEGRR